MKIPLLFTEAGIIYKAGFVHRTSDIVHLPLNIPFHPYQVRHGCEGLLLSLACQLLQLL